MTPQTSIRWLGRVDRTGLPKLLVVTTQEGFGTESALFVLAIAPADDGGTLLRVGHETGPEILHTATPYSEVRDAAKNVCGGRVTMLIRDLSLVEDLPS
jgi:hypothetical protein